MIKHCVNSDGYECWTLDGICHREDGPAIIHPSGACYWFNHGVFHRLDGPAIIRSNNTYGWYVEGIQITSANMFLRISKCSKEHVSWLLLKYGKIE